MKKTEVNHTTNRTSDVPFQIGFYDNKGYINLRRMIKYYLFFGIVFFLITFNLLTYFNLTNNYGYDKGITITYILNIKEWIIDNIFYNKTLSTDFLLFTILSSIIPIFYIIFHYKKVNFRSKIQSKMASLNLNQYYLKKQSGNLYFWKLIKGYNRNYDGFKSKANDIKQMFKTENIKIERTGEDGSIIMKTIPNFPSISRLKKLNINYKDYLKDGYLFLGFTNDVTNVELILKEPLGKKYMNYYRCYISLENLLIHISLTGKSGFGKSNNLASFLNSFLMNMDSIDTLLIHDFKGIENTAMEKGLLKKNDNFKGRIFTSTTMKDLFNTLVKLEIIYEYRKAVMAEKYGDIVGRNYEGGKIILIIDEMNAGFSNLNSPDKETKKLAIETYDRLEVVAQLYRAMGIFLLTSGQSLLGQDNFPQQVRKNSTIQFCLNSSGVMATGIGSRYEEGGEDLTTYGMGETLYLNYSKSNYMKFLPPYIPTNYLEDFINYKPKEKTKLDKDMPFYLDKLESKIIKLREQDIEEKNKLKEEKDQEDIEKTLRIFKLVLKENIEDLKNSIFKRDKKEILIFSENETITTTLKEENETIIKPLKEENIEDENINKPKRKKLTDEEKRKIKEEIF